MTFKLIIILMNLYSLGNSCENEIYCKGRLYELLQENITDEFLDKKMLVDPDKLLLSFRNLTKNINQEENFASFFHKNFGDEKEGVDYEMWNLPDKKLIEAKINNDRNLITFVNYLKELLLKMGLKGTELMRKHKKRYSLLSTTGFIQDHKDSKEASYWETYWVVNGLLFYEMYESTKEILNGLISMVVEFGFVPKSNRIYYTQRSNPPFLTLMAYNFILKTSDYDWLQENIEYLEFELTFWIKNRSIVIEKDKKLHTMFRYSVNCFTPRPESYKSDMELAEELDGKDRKKFFKEINSASESGWDISSRWLNDGDVLDVNVSRVIPVDLNSYLYKNFVCISKLFNMLGNNSKSIVWRKKAKKLHLAIRKILWNETEGIWFDYDVELNRGRSQFYLSNFTPLWAGAFPTRLRYEYGYYASLYIDKYDLIGKYKGCIPDSLQESFQLYDFPNSHTHLLVMVIEGLKSSLHLGAIKKSNVILVKWMDVVMSCWAETNSIFDTYNVKEFGQHTSYTEWSEDHTVTIGAFLSVLDSYYTISERFISNESFGRRLNALCFIFNFVAYVVK